MRVPLQQTANLSLVEAQALIVVPQLRGSRYVDLLKTRLQTLNSASAGTDINDPEIPSLRHLVIVNNLKDDSGFQDLLNRTPGAMDFRDLFMFENDVALDANLKAVTE